MRAIGYAKPLPIEDPQSLLDIEQPDPVASGHDLLVEVRAVSVNPADVKRRASERPLAGLQYQILGYDAAGVVQAVGPEVTLFKPGDEVFYAGSFVRPGTNAELHLVDERIVGTKPRSLDFTRAAGLPLTSLTAWELLFDRLGVPFGKTGNPGGLLIVGAPGGVGTMMLQLARKFSALRIVATASSAESREWCFQMGAHHVIDPTQPFPDQLRAIGIPVVETIASLVASEQYFPALVEVLAPEGKIGLIDDPKSLDPVPLKRKAASLHWELMFTRSMFHTRDMIAQHRILESVSELVDEGILRTNATNVIGPMNAANLKKAHALVERGGARGRVVLEGYESA